MDIIVISDSDSDENELPSLNVTLSDDDSLSGIESKLELQQAGNPFTVSAHLQDADDTFRTNGANARKKSSATSSVRSVVVINLASDDDEEYDRFNMQRIIADRLQRTQSFAPVMGCQGKHGGPIKDTWGDQAQDKAKTWSQRRAEHMALKVPPPTSNGGQIPDSAIRISSEDSGAEDSDTLPDLDNIFQDPHCIVKSRVSDPFCPRESTPKKLGTMGSPKRNANKERHFLDTFQPALRCKQMKEDIKATKSKDMVMVQSVKTASKACSDISKKRKDRISQEMQAGSVPIYQQEYKVFKFPHDTPSSVSIAERRMSSPDFSCKHLRNKFSGIGFLQDLTTLPSVMDKLCSEFVKMQTSCLDDLLGDLCDPIHFSHCIDLLEDFCFHRKPHHWMLDKIMNNGFFNAAGEDTLIRTYHCVLKLWQRFPELIKIDMHWVLVCGDVLQKHLQNSRSSSADSCGSLLPGWKKDLVKGKKPSVTQCKLYFQLFLKGLQLNLSQCTLADQKSINKSLAFSCLSSEGSKILVKQLTHWLEFCLVIMHPERVHMAKMWMCELQTLLAVSVLVSRDRQEAAKKLAPELKRTYKYLTDLSTKKRLLQSFVCPLLCFYVLRLIMEDQCESTIVSSQFPSSLQEIIHNYYMALPPHDHLTPPPSPSEDGQEEMRHGVSYMYSVQSCEELAMLIYFITKSFIVCKQKRLNCDLRQQILKGPSLHFVTTEEKRHFGRSVLELGGHLRALCSDLSVATATYLSLLECLCLTL